ncbi:MAG: hypothetical protein VX951_04170 [Planctomycetota bacterium]|nr:hypothetical protein [Planctomycetota bacterium]
MHHTTFIATALLLASPGFAQTILPKSAATTSPGYWNYSFFFGSDGTRVKNEGHTQVLYAESELGSIVRTFTSLEVRRPQNLGNQNLALTGTMVLDMSSTPTAPSAASSTYAANHVANKTNVVNGQINLPARNRGSVWPDPWETAIPFTTTWIFIPMPGGSLVVDNQFSGNSSNRHWYLEGTRAQRGTRITNLSACSAHSDGGKNRSISYRQPQLGSTWFVNYGSMPSNVPSMNASFQILGVGGVGQAQWGLTLPINLSTLSLPSNNCSLAVTDDFRLPMTYVTSTAGPNKGSLRGVTVPIPNNPQLGGMSFYDQAVGMDTNQTTNAPEIYMSWSSKWTIGSGIGDPISIVFNTGDNTALTGIVRQYEGPTIRLQ